MNHEYSAIGGSPEFCKVAAELQFGADSEVIKSKRVSDIFLLIVSSFYLVLLE